VDEAEEQVRERFGGFRRFKGFKRCEGFKRFR
jgi:hypothetical protein